MTEEEAEAILNKEEFLSNTSSDINLSKKKCGSSMVEFEEISRNLLNSDFDSGRLGASMEKSAQISDKELDHLLSSGFNDLSDVGTFCAKEAAEPLQGSVGAELKDSRPMRAEEGGSEENVKTQIERAISIERSMEKANNTSDLNVLMSEITEFDTGNFFGGSDAVITSQGVLNSGTNLDCAENSEKGPSEPIPEAPSDEDSDASEDDFIDRKSKVEKVRPSPPSQGPAKPQTKQEAPQAKGQKAPPADPAKQA